MSQHNWRSSQCAKREDSGLKLTTVSSPVKSCKAELQQGMGVDTEQFR